MVKFNTDEANYIGEESVDGVTSDKKKYNKKKFKVSENKHFVILELWIQTVKLNCIELMVLNFHNQEKNMINNGYD